MKYLWTNHYTHASAEQDKAGNNVTLCGQKAIHTHVNTSLWNETDRENFDLRPCPKCKKKLQHALNCESVNGKQITLG